MTEKEAINALELEGGIEITGTPKRCSDFFMSLDVAIKAIKEIQKYREIGTVEEFREAKGKQEAKKPDYEGDGYADGNMVYDTWICPCCGERYEIDYEEYEHCPKCGQSIEWSEEK